MRGKAILLTGPRQVGKTTLLNWLVNESELDYLHVTADDVHIRRVFHHPALSDLKRYLGAHELIFIDEAQRIKDVGLTAKLIVDQFPEKQLILSGSSAFELGQEINEPLTGRKWTYNLWPISWAEWESHKGSLFTDQDLSSRLIYGLYPDVLNYMEESDQVLYELVDSYLFKDVLSFGNLRKTDKILKLLQALAFQVGNEVVLREVAAHIGLDVKTVASYLDILEQAFVLFRLPSLSKNLRNEIKTNQKIYFYDNGVRNAIINDLSPFEMRNDKGAIWENFLMAERFKVLNYGKSRARRFFWRTKQQQEIDYVEEIGGKFYAYEFKWSPRKNVLFSKTFLRSYEAETMVVRSDNFREFLAQPV